MNDCSLIHEFELPLPPLDIEVADRIARSFGRLVTDVRTALRAWGGILIPRGERSQLEALAEELCPLGVRSRVVRSEDLLEAPRGWRAVSFARDSSECVFGLRGGREVRASVQDIAAVEVHAIDRPIPRIDEDEVFARSGLSAYAQAGDPGSARRTRRLLETLAELGRLDLDLRLTVFLREPFGPVRFDKEGMDYAFLDDAKSSHSLVNFLTLIERVYAAAVGAWNRTPWMDFVDALDGSGPVSLQPLLRDREDEIVSFERWLLYWIAEDARELDQDIADATGDIADATGDIADATGDIADPEDPESEGGSPA